LADRTQRARERAPFLRQRVFHADRRFGEHGPDDHAFGLEFVEALGEHAVGDAGNGGAQLRESCAILQQQEENGAVPPATDELDGPVEAVAELARQRHDCPDYTAVGAYLTIAAS
jgi:hypothetical protein